MERTYDAAAGWVPENYLAQGEQALRSRKNLFKALLSNRKLPESGWDEASIRYFLMEMAMMDTNNFVGNAGVGEREGRVLSRIVNERHFGLAHGIGRSGDISAIQPKAAGSSLLCKVCNALVKDALSLSGMQELGEVATLPVATGMALTLVLLALKQKNPTANLVIWPRIDQKTCAKCVFGAGLELLVVENKLVGDELVTDVETVQDEISKNKEKVLCVLTTTSCFAPRSVDRIVDVAKLCKQFDVPHVINNAYGVQSSEIGAQVTSAWRKGRVDAVVQSTDKNFMVPVGGAVVAGKVGSSELVKLVTSSYPGRASMSPILDVAITLLSLGRQGWRSLLEERTSMYQYLKQRLESFAEECGERVLETPGNPISLGMTLDNFHETCCEGSSEKTRLLGSKLFHRCVSGARVYTHGKAQTINGMVFANYGAHCDHYPHHYLNAAAAIGMKRADVDVFIEKLRKSLQQLRKNKQGK